jgi:hypothetical protein
MSSKKLKLKYLFFKTWFCQSKAVVLTREKFSTIFGKFEAGGGIF